MAFSRITSRQMKRETVEDVTGFIFLGSKITADGDCCQEIKRCLLFERKAMRAFSFSLHQVFSSESDLLIRWPKYWRFHFSISPSNEYSGLISYRTDWFDLLAIQGTLKSLLQHHSSKALILWHSGFFMVQLSHPQVTTGKTIALTRQTFLCKVMSLLFNMLPKLVITFLPMRKHLLISWLQSPSAVILESKKIKSVTGSIVSLYICHEVMGPDAMILILFCFVLFCFEKTFIAHH